MTTTEDRVHETAVALAELVGEVKGFRGELQNMSETLARHEKASQENYAMVSARLGALEPRVGSVETDVEIAKTSIKAVVSRLGPVLLGMVLAALTFGKVKVQDVVSFLEPTKPSQSDETPAP